MRKKVQQMSSKSYFFYFVIWSTFYIVGISIFVNKPKHQYVLGASTKISDYELSSLPILSDSATIPVVSAQGSLMVDVKSGVILFEKNSSKRLLPASTTKIMTALVALEQYHLDDVLTVTDTSVIGQKMKLYVGEQITARSLLDGLLIYSANDAAEAFASNYPGGRQAFIERMNSKALELGLKNTHYANPSGLDEENHYSTARDMVWLAVYAMKDPTFAQIVSTKTKTVYNTDKSFSHYLWNINELLGKVEGMKGVKTGWTENARENLISYVERPQGEIALAVMSSQDRFGESEELIEWAYKNYSWTKVEVPNFQPIVIYSP